MLIIGVHLAVDEACLSEGDCLQMRCDIRGTLSAEQVLIVGVHLAVDEVCILEGYYLQMRCVYQRDAICRISVACKYPHMSIHLRQSFNQGRREYILICISQHVYRPTS